MREQFCKIVRLMEQHISADPLIVDGERISQYPTGIDAAAEEIEKMYNDMNCGNCKYCNNKGYEALNIFVCPITHLTAYLNTLNNLKCDQWEAKQ